MTFRFERALALLDVHEGGYVNHPADPGGATNRGVTQRTYDAWRRRRGEPLRSVRHIAGDEVKAIYRSQYWDSIRADEMPPGVAYCIFDAGVNSGPARVVKWAQEVVGVDADGIVGEQTLDALARANPYDFINRFCDHRLAFMSSLKHWPTFKGGWKRRVAEVRAQALQWAMQGVAPKPDPNRAPRAPLPRAVGPQAPVALLVAAIVAALVYLWNKVRGRT